MNILIIGGTRQIGHYLTLRLLEEGHHVTLLNRGVSRDDLPESIPRLRCDRTNAKQLRRAIGGRDFDVVIDNVLYTGAEAEHIVNLLDGHVGRYIFTSTGQVYLVREGLERPYSESDYQGEVMPEPEPMSYDYEEWKYGKEKRDAENVLKRAFEERSFPHTTIRLPMVNGERDTFLRMYGYMLRIKDGGPILIPETPDYPLRHIYAMDVVEAMIRIMGNEQSRGMTFNISQDETLSIDEFLTILGEIMDKPVRTVRVRRDLLEEHGFLPDCSPFSDLWMSELDNTLSKDVLGMEYTPVRTYVENIVKYYAENKPTKPVGYRRRSAEKNLVMSQ